MPDKDQERIRNARDPQLERAMDLLKGLSVYSQQAPAKEPRSTKGEKVAKQSAAVPVQ